MVVLMGGGRRHWLPLTDFDREERNQRGRRTDGRNLLDDWVRDKKARDLNAEYVWNKAQFDKVDPRHTDYLLGEVSPAVDFALDEGENGCHT
ncbi:Membrane-bound alkaline phosphatase [Portunus trituberculatus]|uniref:alkaline phosphatase n=1 Tax=Portunus trituberculatus TaxID=210409 RepID=A0A5B7H1C7_PORTR|nr:Membrane-bound alkaline phosphatase [Portunus trituberculatus]